MMNNLQKNWQMKPLGEVADVIGGGTPNTQVAEYWGGDTATHYVDFDFKIKSSAMKILTLKQDVPLYMIYLCMQLLKHDSKFHKRYWISEYQNIKIPIPSMSEQTDFIKKITIIENNIAERKFALCKAEQLFTATLYKAFNGKL